MFFPSSHLYAAMPASSGIFHFLGFQSCMEMGVKQGSQSLPTGQSSLKGPLLQPCSRCLLCLESSRGWAVSAARRFLCNHLWLFIPCLPHQVPPGSVLVAKLQSSQVWGWLSVSALMAVPTLKTRCWTAGCSVNQYCLHSSRVSSFAFQQIAFQCSWYSDTITEMPVLGAAGAWNLLLGIASTRVSLSVSLCCSRPGYFPAELVYVMC